MARVRSIPLLGGISIPRITSNAVSDSLSSSSPFSSSLWLFGIDRLSSPSMRMSYLACWSILINCVMRWVANSLDFNKDYEASVFETTIRVVGGLLSAYDLSSDKVFLKKAKDIADRLLPAWDTPSGVPYNSINLAHGRPHNPGWARAFCLSVAKEV